MPANLERGGEGRGGEGRGGEGSGMRGWEGRGGEGSGRRGWGEIPKGPSEDTINVPSPLKKK